jgi:hypothetical protein
VKFYDVNPSVDYREWSIEKPTAREAP